MTKLKKIASGISLWAIYLLQTKPVFASVVLENGVPVVVDDAKDMWSGIEDTDKAWAGLNEFTGTLVAGITGLIAAIMVGVFVFKAFELTKHSNNPNERQKTIQSMMYSLIAVAILGSISLWITLFYGLLK